MPSSASRVGRFAQSMRRFMCCMYVKSFMFGGLCCRVSCRVSSVRVSVRKERSMMVHGLYRDMGWYRCAA